MSIGTLVKEGLLIRSQSTAQEIEGSMAIAERFLEKARGNKKIEYYDVAFSLAYQAMFHVARALLFKNGLKERGHAALIAALKELYNENTELRGLLQTLASYKITRHAIQYSGIGCNKEDADEAISGAEKFIEAADSVLSEEEKEGNEKEENEKKE